jgi:hypothetical protein
MIVAGIRSGNDDFYEISLSCVVRIHLFQLYGAGDTISRNPGEDHGRRSR